MPWNVTDAKWLQVETDRVQELVLMPVNWHRAWTLDSLKEALLTAGMDYSEPDLTLIETELHTRGVVADLGP